MGSRAAWRKALALISLALVLLLARVNGDESASDPGRVADAGGDVANGGDGANGGDVANGEEAGKEGGNAGKDGIKVPTPLKDEQDPMDDAIKKGLYFYVTQEEQCFVVPQSGARSFHVHYYFPQTDEGKQQISLWLTSLEINSRDPRDRRGSLGRPPIDLRQRKQIGATEKIGETMQGKLAFKTLPHLSHYLCVKATSKDGKRELKLFLNIDVTADEDISQMLKKDAAKKGGIIPPKPDNDLEQNSDPEKWALYKRMVRMRMNADRMLKHADVLEQEERANHVELFRLTRGAAWWPIFQVILLLGTSYYQVRYLRQYFKSKRLV